MAKRFDVTVSRRPISIQVFHFVRGTSLKDAIAEMSKAGCRPATKKERQAFYKEYPEKRSELLGNFLAVSKTPNETLGELIT